MAYLCRSCLAFFLLCFMGLPSELLAQQSDSPRRLISLDGGEWKLLGLDAGQGEKQGIPTSTQGKSGFIATTVPSDVQTSIGLKDPLGQDPEVWQVTKKEWWYVRSFASPEISPAQQCRLVFDGVDYLADVWLNGEKLGSHEGAYTAFEYDVTKRLHANGSNYLAVRVTAPWKMPGRFHAEIMKGEYDAWWDAHPGIGQIVFPVGVHRSVRLEVTSSTRINEFQVATRALRTDRADLKVHATLSSSVVNRDLSLRVTMRPENFSGAAVSVPARSLSLAGSDTQQVDIDFQVPDPKLWWTWDQGPQNLYVVECALVDGKGQIIDKTSSVFGIRTLERDNNILYKINGKPVFLRGAWLPMSRVYPGQVNAWTYEKDLRMARQANMNHIMVYTTIEKPEFYDLADRLGILLFTELPFNQTGPLQAVNKDYPGRDRFLNWSASEVAQMARSLANHPSVGVWSPLAEVTGLNGTGSFGNRGGAISEAADGYDLFSKRIEEAIVKNDQDALYFPSYCDFGERHFWMGGPHHNGTVYDSQFDALTGFVSEYGAHAVFSLENVRRMVNPDDFWGKAPATYSSLALPIDPTKMSYVNNWQYTGMDFLTMRIRTNVDRHVGSFQDYVSDAWVWQKFMYGYAGDSYRRKLFNPINGARSYALKSHSEKPVSGYGVFDAFHTASPAFYEERRTFAPISMSYAERYSIESMPAGTTWKVPVWLSNATTEPVTVTIESVLYDLTGKQLSTAKGQGTVAANNAAEVTAVSWKLPSEPGIYLVRGRARQGATEVATAEMYLKVVPTVTRKTLRVLVVGSARSAHPVAEYLANFGASVSRVVYDEDALREPPYPASSEVLRRNYDVIWLTNFDTFYREAPEHLAQIIAEAVESGVTFIHSGGMGSFHGGGASAAGLDFTALANVLPVLVQHENDVYPRTSYRVGEEINEPPAGWPGKISVTDTAPQWLRDVDFRGLTPTSGYHILKPRPNAQVLLQLENNPLLVKGTYGKGITLAYLGFTPAPPPRPAESESIRDHEPVIVDRAIRSSSSNRLFANIAAALLALAAQEQPTVPLGTLLESRAKPLFESLKNVPAAPFPSVSLGWSRNKENRLVARIQIHNGNSFVRGLRLRFDGPEFEDGSILPLWTDQFFDLLPGQDTECSVELVSGDGKITPRDVRLIGETLYGTTSNNYAIPALPQMSGALVKK